MKHTIKLSLLLCISSAHIHCGDTSVTNWSTWTPQGDNLEPVLKAIKNEVCVLLMQASLDYTSARSVDDIKNKLTETLKDCFNNAPIASQVRLNPIIDNDECAHKMDALVDATILTFAEQKCIERGI